MNQLKVKSPAKINIGLNIIRKRDDGYHDLETIFYPLKIHDEIIFTRSDKLSFRSNDENLNKEKSNLIIKAKEQLEKYSGSQINIAIILSKNIPIGAGLGGGSSNAAATLLALNKMYELNIEAEKLSDIALQLGSDVPYFLNPIPSFAESRGEILFPLNLKIDRPILIVNPGIHISTRWAFGLIKPHLAKISLKKFVESGITELDELQRIAVNDFEEIVFSKYPDIKFIKAKMIEAESLLSMMTGTGSTVFGIFENKKAAIEAAQMFPDNYFKFIND
ncbi:MAG: 4-(cytidine 5'-diphospho)-2-C-methyl-D-erythritol kinase [Ignavibacteriaceae bacterium]|nr:4-(cytidine 5'-diphospho)-2-C-methyl-D-erythritol kinase [Ignavibacteriaceae bacterium]